MFGHILCLSTDSSLSEQLFHQPSVGRSYTVCPTYLSVHGHRAFWISFSTFETIRKLLRHASYELVLTITEEFGDYFTAANILSFQFCLVGNSCFNFFFLLKKCITFPVSPYGFRGLNSGPQNGCKCPYPLIHLTGPLFTTMVMDLYSYMLKSVIFGGTSSHLTCPVVQ